MSETDASYEVSVQVGARWEIHARYPVTGGQAAIEEAKQLEQASKSAVKVVREVYDTDSGLYKQMVVYRSAHAAAEVAEAPPAGKGSGFKAEPISPSDDFDDDFAPAPSRGFFSRRRSYGEDEDNELEDLYTGADSRRRKARIGRGGSRSKGPKQVTLGGLMIRIAIVIMVSLLIAALITGFLPVFAPHFATRNLSIAGGGQASALFVVFVGAFLVSFAIMAAVALTGLEVIAPQRRARVAVSSRAAAPKRLNVPPRPIADFTPILDPEPEPEPEAEPEPAPPENAEEPGEEDGEVNLLEADDTSASPVVPLSAAGEQQKMKMMTFLGGALEGVSASGPIDAFSRFGINLFTAGAVDALSTTQGIEAAEGRAILADGIKTLGTPEDMARKFAESAESYLMQPRYLEMHESGRRAMMSFLEGDEEGPKQLGSALQTWRNPTKEEDQRAPLAVLFTDIVGSTRMTVTIGDDAAQYVVRTHNRIVRSALTNFHGREIKHTGDGIMASFATVSNAVEAAIEMQRRVAANNAAEGDVPLHLCIGINAGEPVVEDDDLFGVTVQLSARLCAAAESDQIIVSEVVRGLCTGKPIRFESRGTKEMKGFKEPVPIYEVAWQDGAAAGGA